MSSNDPEAIRADIERTRAEISNDVNALAEGADPRRIAGRQVQKVKDGARSLVDKVFGSDDDATGYREPGVLEVPAPPSPRLRRRCAARPGATRWWPVRSPSGLVSWLPGCCRRRGRNGSSPAT